MLDSELRDELVRQVEHAQISALHRALDKAWLEGYEAGIKLAKERRKTMSKLAGKTCLLMRSKLNKDPVRGRRSVET